MKRLALFGAGKKGKFEGPGASRLGDAVAALAKESKVAGVPESTVSTDNIHS